MLTPIQEIRIQVGDYDSSLPLLDDATYEYFLSKNENSIRRSAIDAARAILFQLTMRSDETIDIFTIKGSKSAEQYRLALKMFLSDPTLNPVLTSASIYAGGVSKTDMQTNVNTTDNNAVITPDMDNLPAYDTAPTDYFSV